MAVGEDPEPPAHVEPSFIYGEAYAVTDGPFVRIEMPVSLSESFKARIATGDVTEWERDVLTQIKPAKPRVTKADQKAQLRRRGR